MNAHGRICSITLTGAAVLVGCAVGPDYSPQAPPHVEGYVAEELSSPVAGPGEPEQRLASVAEMEDRWWEAFDSDALNELIERAFGASPTLDTARAVLAEAHEVLLAGRGAFFPQVDVSASAARENRGSLRAGTLTPGAATFGTTTAGAIDVFSVGPVVSFPLDVFGRLRRDTEQRAALVDVQRAELQAAYLTLTGNIVTQAINLASASEQLAAVAEIIQIDERNLELTKVAAAAGRSAQLDVLSATSQLATDRTLLPPLRQQLDTAAHALSVLVGAFPAEWTPPSFDFHSLTLPAQLPVIVPSALVRRRPDIVAAEAQLHASNAAIGVAAAQLYPDFALSGSWSRISTRGAGVLDASADLWSIALNLTAPIFHGGTLRAQHRAAIQAYAAQLGTYRQTLLQAFGQVADVLRALGHDAETVAAQRAALEASKASLQLTQEAYQAGYASLLQVLDAQRLYEQARLGYVRAQSQRYLDSVQLFIAMGGGKF